MVRSTDTYYTIVLYKDKTLLKIFPIATMTVGCTMDIPADEYTEKNELRSTLLQPQHHSELRIFDNNVFLNEQYSVFTYTTYSLIQTQRDCIHSIGFKKFKCIFECNIYIYIYCKFVCQYSMPFH